MRIDLDTSLEARARAACDGRGPAHDWLHVVRVRRVAGRIARAEGADVRVVDAAALLHELVNLPKDHPESHTSGDLCAIAARDLLRGAGWADDDADRVAACIRDHAWSKGAAPGTLEAAVLQDADRIDAIGAIGVARCMATCTELGRPFYDPADPLARARPLDDQRFGLDHVFQKLLRIPERLHTPTARRLATPRVAALRAWVDALVAEIA